MEGKKGQVAGKCARRGALRGRGPTQRPFAFRGNETRTRLGREKAMSEELDGVEAADAVIEKRVGERVAKGATVAGDATDGEGVAKGASVAADATDGEGVAKGAKVADEATDEGPHLLSEKETPEWTPEQREDRKSVV